MQQSRATNTCNQTFDEQTRHELKAKNAKVNKPICPRYATAPCLNCVPERQTYRKKKKKCPNNRSYVGFDVNLTMLSVQRSISASQSSFSSPPVSSKLALSSTCIPAPKPSSGRTLPLLGTLFLSEESGTISEPILHPRILSASIHRSISLIAFSTELAQMAEFHTSSCPFQSLPPYQPK